MQQAVGTQDWFDYVPGLFPSNISDVKAVSPTELTMKMNKPYNTTWFTYNELSQITPLPAAWDRTAPQAARSSTSATCPPRTPRPSRSMPPSARTRSAVTPWPR